MKDLNKEGKLLLMLIPGILILVVVFSVLNNRATREQEMKESMEAAVRENIEAGVEEARGHRFQEELDTIEFLGLEGMEKMGSGRARAQVNIGMLDLPSLLEEYLADSDITEHVEEGLDYYVETYEALRAEYKEGDPYVFAVDVKFREVEEGQWEITSEEALKIHSANRDIPLMYYGGLDTLGTVFDEHDPFQEEEPLKEQEQDLLSFYHRNINRGKVTVDKEVTEEAYGFVLDYQGYDLGALEEEMEKLLLSEFYDGEVRKNHTLEGIERLKQVMEGFFQEEELKSHRVKEVTVKKKGIGFILEDRGETLENPHKKLREYLAFLQTVEEVPAFFARGHQNFELLAEQERLRVRRSGQEDGGEIILYGEPYTGYDFHRWSLREDTLEEGTPISANREDLEHIQSHQVLDFAQVYHRENLSTTLLPIQGEEGTGFINEKGEVVIEPFKGLSEFAAGDQGISQTHYILPLIFSVQKEEGEMPINYAIDEEGEILKALSGEEVADIRAAARENGWTTWSEEYAQNRYRLETFGREDASGLMQVRTTGGSYHGETETLIEPQYDGIRIPSQTTPIWEQREEPDKEKKAVIAVQGEEEFLINLNNERLTPVDYDAVVDFDNSLFQGILSVDGEKGLYDFENSRWIVEPGQEEGDLYFLRQDRRRIDRDGKIGFKDGENRRVIEPRYEKPTGPGRAGEFYMGYAAVTKEEEHLIIDQEETVIHSEPRSKFENPLRITYIPELELLTGGRRVYFTLEGDLIYQ